MKKYITFGFLDMAKGIDHIFVSKDITHNIINLTISDDRVLSWNKIDMLSKGLFEIGK